MKKKLAVPLFSVRFKAQGVPSGHVSVPDLLTICEEAQRAVTRQAEALEGRKTQHPGPTSDFIKRECMLELIGLRKGSTTLQFCLAHPQQKLPISDYRSIGAEVARELASTIRALGAHRKRADIRDAESRVFDEGVLNSLYKLGSIVEGERLKTLELIVPKSGAQPRISAKIEKSTRENIARRLSQPRKAHVQVDGTLDMADFKPGDKRCRIDPPIGPSIVCAFDDEMEDRIYSLLRKPVRISGLATIVPQTGRVETLTISNLEPLPSLALGEGSFFVSHSLDELADLQKVEPIRNSNVLAGGIPDSEDLDEFLRGIYESRR
jgi:hypothetical protein